MKLTRRRLMELAGMGALTAGGAGALDDDGGTGQLFGGTMALSQAFKVASGDRDWYQGPDSAKDDISGQNGDRYSATDTQVEYYWDGGWTLLGIGSDSQAVPEVFTENADITSKVTDPTDHVTRDLVRARSTWSPSRMEFPFVGPDIPFASLKTFGFEPQGLAYRDGNIYVAEVTDSATETTIHETDLDGATTGETIQFGGATGINHVSGLEWKDGFLWAVDFTTDQVLKVDWDAKSQVGSFDTDTDPSTITFVPSRGQQDDKLLISYWNTDKAHLVDYKQAITDGDGSTGSGNVDTDFRNGHETTVQGLSWRDGFLYMALNGIYIVKRVFPYADDIDADASLTNENIVWWRYTTNVSDVIQDLAYDWKQGRWYTAGENSNNFYRAREKITAIQPEDWSAWSLVNGGPGSSKVLDADSSQRNTIAYVHIFPNPISGIVTWWYFDDTETSSGNGKRVYLGVSDATNANRQTMAVNTSQTNGDSNYYRWNNTDGWTDTGVTRVNNAQWVLFRWVMTGNQCKMLISKDFGTTWSSAGTDTDEAVQVETVAIEPPAGSAKIGPYTIEPIY